MKHIITWRAFIIATGELVRGKTEIDCSDLGKAEILFYKKFNFNKYRKLKVVNMKVVK